MGKKAARWFAAFIVVALVGFVAIPGCKIKLCKGSGCGGGPDVGGWGGGGATGGAGGGWAGAGGAGGATDPLSTLDPTELAAGEARAGYAAYMLSGLVGEKIAASPDPANVDSATVHGFVDEAEPIAWAAADEWIKTIDLQSLPGLTPKYECVAKPYECSEQYHKCAFSNICIVVDCGETKCSTCPDIWPLPQLAFDRWCVYTCIVDDPPVITGWAIRFHITLLDEWAPVCHANN